MATITASQVKELRDATNVSMMDCKRALVEAEGDITKAGILLRERGIAVAAKKADRAANQGLIASATSSDGSTVSLVEVNCETDFVARNDEFIAFVASLAERACDTDGNLGEENKEEVTAKIAEVGENIVIPRNERYTVSGTGAVGAYVHSNSKIGVLIEIGCTKTESTTSEAFQQLLKDLCLHAAASSPRFLKDDEVPEAEVTSEKAIFAKQVEGKPEQIVEKIVAGKIRKFYQEICFLNQGFVKEPKQTITELLSETGKALGDTIEIRKFKRYQMGA